MTAGSRFYKMTGSGNDFIVFDSRTEPLADARDAAWVERVCSRGTGIGADGVVVIERAPDADFRMVYVNRDGSSAMCGNAALCATRLAAEIGAGDPAGMRFATDAGIIRGRVTNGLAEVEFGPVGELQLEAPVVLVDGELRVGYADSGVPHFVVLCADANAVNVATRGAELRHHPSRPLGVNVNFVSAHGSALGQEGWVYRTFERGVEDETLACGTGAIAIALLLRAWGLASGPETALRTRSGGTLVVRLRDDGGLYRPTLRGEGRIVYVGELREP